MQRDKYGVWLIIQKRIDWLIKGMYINDKLREWSIPT